MRPRSPVRCTTIELDGVPMRMVAVADMAAWALDNALAAEAAGADREGATWRVLVDFLLAVPSA